jgi:hypothetical protein
MKLKELEKLMVDHLKESGEIRTDIKWLKRAFWGLVGIGGVAAGSFLTVVFEFMFRVKN